MNLRFFPRLFYAIIVRDRTGQVAERALTARGQLSKRWLACATGNDCCKREAGWNALRKLRDVRSVRKSPHRRWSVTGRDKPRNARLLRAGSYQNAGSLARQGTIAARGKRAGTLLENLTALGAFANCLAAGGP